MVLVVHISACVVSVTAADAADFPGFPKPYTAANHQTKPSVTILSRSLKQSVKDFPGKKLHVGTVGGTDGQLVHGKAGGVGPQIKRWRVHGCGLSLRSLYLQIVLCGAPDNQTIMGGISTISVLRSTPTRKNFLEMINIMDRKIIHYASRKCK